jgi:YggT family protein
MGEAVVWLVNQIINLMVIFIIVQAVASWLVAFNVINARNQLVYSILRFLDAVTSPLLEPFRRIIPTLGGVDVSPIVVLLLLRFAQIAFNSAAAPYLLGFA